MKNSKRIVLTIENNGSRNHKLKLLDYMDELEGYLLPKGIAIKVDILQNGKKIRGISYIDLMRAVLFAPLVVNVFKSTDNRRLDFFYYNPIGERRPIVPVKLCVIKGGRNIKTDTWNPKQWNIADTKQAFILGDNISIHLKINEGELFKLQFKMHPTKKVKF